MFHRPPIGHTTATRQLPDLAFATNRVLGNIGAPLEPSQWDDYEYEPEETFESEEFNESSEHEDKVVSPISPTTTDSEVCPWSLTSRGMQLMHDC